MKPDDAYPATPRIEHYTPLEVAQAVDTQGVSKAKAPALTTLALSVLGGAFVALGGMFTLTVLGHPEVDTPMTTVLTGFAFSLGFVISIVAGAELFTSNNLVVMSWVSRRITLYRLTRNWLIVYTGNAIGATSVALTAFGSDWWLGNDVLVGGAAVTTAVAKVSSPLHAAFLSAVQANALVCLAAWMAIGARSTTDKFLATIFPITAMAAMGLQHVVGFMFFVPLGVLLAQDPQVVAASGLDPSLPALRDYAGIVGTFLAVTLGNVIGGAGLVGLVYWWVYLRPVADQQ